MICPNSYFPKPLSLKLFIFLANLQAEATLLKWIILQVILKNIAKM